MGTTLFTRVVDIAWYRQAEKPRRINTRLRTILTVDNAATRNLSCVMF
jgi:hypothetical protein